MNCFGTFCRNYPISAFSAASPGCLPGKHGMTAGKNGMRTQKAVVRRRIHETISENVPLRFMDELLLAGEDDGITRRSETDLRSQNTGFRDSSRESSSAVSLTSAATTWTHENNSESTIRGNRSGNCCLRQFGGLWCFAGERYGAEQKLEGRRGQ